MLHAILTIIFFILNSNTFFFIYNAVCESFARLTRRINSGSRFKHEATYLHNSVRYVALYRRTTINSRLTRINTIVVDSFRRGFTTRYSPFVRC